MQILFHLKLLPINHNNHWWIFSASYYYSYLSNGDFLFYISYQLIEFYSKVKLLLYLFIWLCQYRLMDTYFFPWVKIQYYHFLCCSNYSSFGCQKLLQVDSCVPLISPLLSKLYCLSTSLFYGPRCPRLIYFPCSIYGVNHLSKETQFLLLENCVINQDLGTKCAHCQWYFSRLSQQTELGNIYILTHPHTHIYISVSVCLCILKTVNLY